MNASSRPQKRALVLAGGGIAGALYEVGALRAMDDLLQHQTVNDFDIFVGTSAGSLISACLANGISTRELMRMIEGMLPNTNRLQRDHILAPNLAGFFRRSRRIPRLVLKRLTELLRNPLDFTPVEIIWKWLEALPNGLYSTRELDRYLGKFLESRGSNHFADLKRELYIVATELDTGSRAVFGMDELRDIRISQAVAASSAMPIVYEPVRINDIDYIDGGVRGTASLDVAIERGANLIVCINPLVAFDNRQRKLGSRIADAGLQAIGNQVFRTFIHAGLRYHIKKLRQQHPEVDIILIEPQADDETIFKEHVMHFDQQMHLARHGYESATTRMVHRYQEYKTILARHGVLISRHRVAREIAHLFANDDPEMIEAIMEGDSSLTQLTRSHKSWRTVQLAHTLEDLRSAIEYLG